MLRKIPRKLREPRRQLVPTRPIDTVLAQLKNVQKSAERQWSARCPGHNDTSPSLSVNKTEDGDVLLYCHVGCTVEKILAAIGLEMADLFNHTSNVTAPRKRDEVRSAKAKPHAAKKSLSTPPAEQVRTNSLALKTAADAVNDWAALTRKYEEALSEKRLKSLVDQLGVTAKSLQRLHVGWRNKLPGTGSYAFPEFNGQGEVVGISLRFEDGRKGFIKGGKRGLYLPDGWEERKGPILIVEGATDTAALAAMRLAGIGRPSARGGVEFLADLLAEISNDREIFVVGELDAKSDGSWPGKDGAKHIADELAFLLRRPIGCALPPRNAKDVRDWLGRQMESQQQ